MQNNKNIFEFYQSSGLYDRVIFKNKNKKNSPTLEKLKEKYKKCCQSTGDDEEAQKKCHDQFVEDLRSTLEHAKKTLADIEHELNNNEDLDENTRIYLQLHKLRLTKDIEILNDKITECSSNPPPSQTPSPTPSPPSTATPTPSATPPPPASSSPPGMHISPF